MERTLLECSTWNREDDRAAWRTVIPLQKEGGERRTLACTWLESTVCACVCVRVHVRVLELIDEMNSGSMRLILADLLFSP